MSPPTPNPHYWTYLSYASNQTSSTMVPETVQFSKSTNNLLPQQSESWVQNGEAKLPKVSPKSQNRSPTTKLKMGIGHQLSIPPGQLPNSHTAPVKTILMPDKTVLRVQSQLSHQSDTVGQGPPGYQGRCQAPTYLSSDAINHAKRYCDPTHIIRSPKLDPGSRNSEPIPLSVSSPLMATITQQHRPTKQPPNPPEEKPARRNKHKRGHTGSDLSNGTNNNENIFTITRPCTQPQQSIHPGVLAEHVSTIPAPGNPSNNPINPGEEGTIFSFPNMGATVTPPDPMISSYISNSNNDSSGSSNTTKVCQESDTSGESTAHDDGYGSNGQLMTESIPSLEKEEAGNTEGGMPTLITNVSTSKDAANTTLNPPIANARSDRVKNPGLDQVLHLKFAPEQRSLDTSSPPNIHEFCAGASPPPTYGSVVVQMRQVYAGLAGLIGPGAFACVMIMVSIQMLLLIKQAPHNTRLSHLIYEIAMCFCTVSLSFCLVAALVSFLQLYLSCKLLKLSPSSGIRILLYLRESQYLRFICYTGLFISVPLQIIAMICFISLDNDSIVTVVTAVFSIFGVMLCVATVCHSSYAWLNGSLRLDPREKIQPKSPQDVIMIDTRLSTLV